MRGEASRAGDYYCSALSAGGGSGIAGSHRWRPGAARADIRSTSRRDAPRGQGDRDDAAVDGAHGPPEVRRRSPANDPAPAPGRSCANCPAPPRCRRSRRACGRPRPDRPLQGPVEYRDLDGRRISTTPRSSACRTRCCSGCRASTSTTPPLTRFSPTCSTAAFMASPDRRRPAGPGGLSERCASQRGLRRHRELGLHPGIGDHAARRPSRAIRSSVSTRSAGQSRSR